MHNCIYAEEARITRAHPELARLRHRGFARKLTKLNPRTFGPHGKRIWRVVSVDGRPDHVEGPLQLRTTGTSCSDYGDVAKPLLVVTDKRGHDVILEGCITHCFFSAVFDSRMLAARYLKAAQQVFARDSRWNALHRTLRRRRLSRGTGVTRLCGVQIQTVHKRQGL